MMRSRRGLIFFTMCACVGLTLIGWVIAFAVVDTFIRCPTCILGRVK